MTAQTEIPNAVDNPYKAATWLVRRHDSAEHPQIENPFAFAYAPMSSGEHRFFRMLGVLSGGQRIRFNLSDADVSFQCCSPDHFGGPRPHDSLMTDWALLITRAVVR